MRIPVAWLNDGTEDCMSGIDELSIWPTCKALDFLRLVKDNTTCENTFICSRESEQFVELDNLCGARYICGVERMVCQAARLTEEPFVSPLLYKMNSQLLYCLPGLDGIQNMLNPCSEEVFRNPDYPTFGVLVQTKLNIPSEKMNCKHLFGEIYVYMSCMQKCTDSAKCILKPLRSESCSKEPFTKHYTLSGNGNLSFIVGQKNRFHNNFYRCNNDKCLTYDKVCNLVNDCGDNSDEERCDNHFQCRTSKEFINSVKKCNGVIDCIDYSDECNMDCGKVILSGNLLKISAWTIGIFAVILNFLILGKISSDFYSNFSTVGCNKLLRMTVAIGDFLTGMYLLFIALADFIFQDSYCVKQHSWMSSTYCATLGVISTFGANISIYSMTCLSIFRVFNMQNLSSKTNKCIKLIMSLVFSLIAVASVTISVSPLLENFKDFFVNGLTYEKRMQIFMAAVDKKTHMNVLHAYHGKILKKDLSWDEIQRLVKIMFTQNYGMIHSRYNHFYGNDGVCLFKYFVKNDDPQKLFVWANLSVIFLSTIAITNCYGMIIFRAKASAKSVQSMMACQEKSIDKHTLRLQKKVTRIILTDLLCWVPFLLICLLHSLEVLDATFLYPFFSIIVLPINSMINPLIYDDFIRKHIVTNVIVSLRWCFKSPQGNVRKSDGSGTHDIVEINIMKNIGPSNTDTETI